MEKTYPVSCWQSTEDLDNKIPGLKCGGSLLTRYLRFIKTKAPKMHNKTLADNKPAGGRLREAEVLRYLGLLWYTMVRE